MATSGTMDTSNVRVKYKIAVTQNSQNVNNNSSNVTVSVEFYRTDTGYTTYGAGTVYCKIDGITYSAAVSQSQKITNDGVILFAKNLNIPHNSDGSKTLTVSAWISLDTPLTSEEQSYSLALTTIPRATTPTLSVSSIALGLSLTISLPRASSSYTHTLSYKLGDASGVIGTNVETSADWAPPLTLAEQLPDSETGTVVIICDTYNGAVKVGTRAINLTVLVPSGVLPEITEVSFTEMVSGLYAKFGAFVQGRSKIGVSVQAIGARGSSIVSCISEFGPSSFNGTDFIISDVLESGSVNLTVTVTDSRGRQAIYTEAVTVLAYEIPSILAFSGYRCDQNGDADDTGQYVKLVYSYLIAALGNNNDKAATIAYKLGGALSWTDLKTESNYSATGAVYIPSTTFATNNSFEFKITVEDYFTETDYIVEIGEGFTLLDFSAGGRGIGVGKLAEAEDLLDVALPIRARGGISFGGSVLWSGANQMDDTQTITLTEDISDQAAGIALVFSAYSSGAAVDSDFMEFFIPKTIVSQKPGEGHSFVLAKSLFSAIATKYLYISNGSITGSADNTASGSANGITYDNGAFCLRYVVGV